MSPRQSAPGLVLAELRRSPNPAVSVFGVPPALTDAELNALLDQFPALTGRRRRLEDLPGGLTNRNVKVSTEDGNYVARCADPENLLGIDREAEYHNSRAAEAAGVGAPVVGYRPDLGILLVGFLDGVTLTNDDFGRPGVIARVAAGCRALHNGPRFRGDFDMFALQPQYLRVVLDNGFRLPAGYLDFAESFGRIQQVLAAGGMVSVPCHNDLLAANFIENGDRTDRKKARLKYVLDRWGHAKYLEETEKKLPFKLTRLPLADCEPRPLVQKHGHLGVHAQKQTGRFYIGVLLPVGRLTSDQMRGSWAGAMGNMQFMPSTFTKWAVDRDGNGRIGRLLVTLLLEHWKLLTKPLLYLSLFFKRHREQYYRRLDAVRIEGDWEGWLDFFLDGAEEFATAGDTVRLPMGKPHGIFNKTQQTAKTLFWVSPTRRLYDLFWAIHNMKQQNPDDVVKLAADMFGTKPSENVKIVTADGFKFIAAAKDQTYDVIYMDAFLKPSADTDGTGAPLALRTQQFYKQLQEKLKPGGVVAFNLNPHADLDADEARAETYCVAYHRMVNAAGEAADMIAGLRYVDRFERRSGEWRIARRVCAYEWRRTEPAVGEGFSFADGYERGQHGEADIIHRIMQR